MFDRALPRTSTIAAILWGVGIILICIDIFTRVETGDLGVVICCGGCVLNVRGFFCDLSYREQNAFRLGRDSVLSDR